MPETSDQELIAAVLAGDRQAFTALFERYRRRLGGALRGRMDLSAENVEDVVQETFEALAAHEYAALRRFAGQSSFYTYLCAIAFRRVYRLHRRQVPVVESEAEQPFDPGADPTDQEVTATGVRQALEKLPEDFRTALLLHHFGGLEYHEIAQMLGIPTNTVATRICRAKKRLREILTE